MLDTEIYAKTEAGRDEIRSRALGLSMATRAILLMVDGQRTVSAMRALIAGSKAPADVLDGLLAQGLIAPKAGDAAIAPTPVAPPPPALPPSASSLVPSAVPPPAPARAAPVEPRRAPPPVVAGPATPPLSRSSYDGPLDLVLPTIYGHEADPEPTGDAAASDAGPSIIDAELPPGLDRYEHLYAMMNEIVRDFLAPHRRYFFQLKIERCTTADELLELLHGLQTALAKARGEAFASEVISRLRAAAA